MAIPPHIVASESVVVALGDFEQADFSLLADAYRPVGRKRIARAVQPPRRGPENHGDDALDTVDSWVPKIASAESIPASLLPDHGKDAITWQVQAAIAQLRAKGLAEGDRPESKGKHQFSVEIVPRPLDAKMADFSSVLCL
jgi:hypothetical protein